jgi:hypothetical protein
MSEPKFDIVFENRFVEGAEPEQVKKRLRQIFRISREDAARFFSGQRIVIRRGVALEEAHRFKNVLRQVGAACRLVPQETAPPTTPPPSRPRPVSGPAADSVSMDDPLEEKNEPETGRDGRRPKRLLAEFGHRLQQRLVRTPKGRQHRRRRRPGQLLAGALVLVVVVSLAAFWPGGKPMPADAATLQRFETTFKTRLLAIETGRARAITQARVAKAAIEDMGYDYDQTLLAWYYSPTLGRDGRGREIRTFYLLGPLKDLFELEPEQLRTLMEENTYALLENTLDIGEHITLRSIRMLKACARGETHITHEDLVAGLAKFDIAVDGDFPEIAVEEAFYGLSLKGLIQIATSREWKTKKVAVTILDPAGIAGQEQKLRQLEQMYARFDHQP